ncbi:hypothetical protein PM082_022758 [Marasmius tenuissimus]|nr:hypothetical protein PM082_022758 [Marasmius tenuissimus]
MAASRMGAWAGGRWAQGGLGDFEAETNYLSERTDNPLPSLHGPSESFGQAEGRTAIAMSRDYALGRGRRYSLGHRAELSALRARWAQCAWF